MKCDGTKPACQQCTKAKKGEACEYDDGKGKTRTQLMREHIARLESKIKELESSTEHTTPPVTLFDPHAASPYLSESSSSSGHDSPGAFSISTSASPVPFLDGDQPSWEEHWGSLNEFASSQIADAFAPEDPPLELAQMLLEIFLPHRHQCGLEIHVGRLRESLTRPPAERRHPVLMNAIYLWACYMSRPGPLGEHESLYLSRALAARQDALPNPSRVIDLIQAQCILSIYFLSNGRILEGSYHASSAASLAVQWGLHQTGAPDVTPGSMLCDWDLSSFRLEPPVDALEQGERIRTFWQVYDLDRCWSVVLGRPSIIPDSKHPRSTITTPWPQRMEEYEAGGLDIGSGSPVITAFFVHQAQASVVGGFSTAALRAKASALFEGSQKLSSSWNPRLPPSTNFSENFRAFDGTIARFTASLLPVHQVAAMPEDKFTLYLIHTLAQTAMIRLHQPFITDDQLSREKSVRAASAVVLVVKHIAEADFDFLDPLIGHCWMTASRVLTFELAQMQTAWPPLDTANIRSEIATLLYALTKLGTRFPLLGYEGAKMQKMLDSA